MKKNNIRIIYAIGFGILAIFCSISFFSWAVVPHMQMKRYFTKIIAFKDDGDINALAHVAVSKDMFAPYAYIQSDLRNDFMSRIFFLDGHNGAEYAIKLLPSSIRNMEAVIAHGEHYTKFYHSLGRAYTIMSKEGPVADRQTYLDKAEASYHAAYLQMPGNQEVAHVYAISLINNKKFDDAIALMQKTYASDTRVKESEYYLGLTLYQAGPAHYDEALEHLEGSIPEIGELSNNDVNIKMYAALFEYYYKQKDITRFLTVTHRLALMDPEHLEMYHRIGDYIRAHKSFPVINISR